MVRTKKITSKSDGAKKKTAAKKAEECYHRGLGLLRAGNHEEAEPEIRRAIKINPEHAGAHYVLAVVLEENHGQP